VIRVVRALGHPVPTQAFAEVPWPAPGFIPIALGRTITQLEIRGIASARRSGMSRDRRMARFSRSPRCNAEVTG